MRVLDLVSWLWVALSVSVATRALGVLPVFAFAVLPAVTGMLLFVRLRWVLLTASGMGALSGGGGYIVTFFSDLPVGACQAAVAALLLALAVALRLARRTL